MTVRRYTEPGAGWCTIIFTQGDFLFTLELCNLCYIFYVIVIVFLFQMLGGDNMKKNNNTEQMIQNHNHSRREFIKKTGRLLAWVPPALVVISQNRQAFANQSWNNGRGNLDHYGDGNGGPDHYKKK